MIHAAFVIFMSTLIALDGRWSTVLSVSNAIQFDCKAAVAAEIESTMCVCVNFGAMRS